MNSGRVCACTVVSSLSAARRFRPHQVNAAQHSISASGVHGTRENYNAKLRANAHSTKPNTQTSLQEKLALIQGLPRIIEQAVKPMQNIDSIRIMQVDGLNAANGCAHAGDGLAGTPSTNLAEQAVGAALKYRAYAPVVDQLIKEVGLSGDGLGSLVKAASTNVVTPAQT